MNTDKKQEEDKNKQQGKEAPQNDTPQAPSHTTQIGSVTGPVHTGSGDILVINQAEEKTNHTKQKRPNITVHTNGGAFIIGDVDVKDGDFVGRDQQTVQRESDQGTKETPQLRPETIAPNPFTDTLMIRDAAHFIGRVAELRRLKTLLQGGSVTLLGEPKIGKSSLLWQLKRDWGEAVIGPLDCQGLEDRDDFYEQLAGALRVDSNRWRAIRSALQRFAGLLLLDELDAAPRCRLTHDDLARLRAVCNQNRALKLVAVSRTPLKQVFPDSGQSSPAYNFLQPLTLRALTPDEAQTLLAHPWAPEAPHFDGATCAYLIQISQRHPFKLQRIAHHRYESLTNAGYDWQAAYAQEMEQIWN